MLLFFLSFIIYLLCWNSFLIVLIFHCLTVKEEIRPTFQNRTLKLATSMTVPQTLAVERSAEALVTNCKGSLLPPVPLPHRGLSLTGLNRARSLPGKYCYHSNSSMLSSSLHSSVLSSTLSSSIRSSARPPTPCRCLCSSLHLAWNRANIPLPSTVCACVKMRCSSCQRSTVQFSLESDVDSLLLHHLCCCCCH